MTIPREALGTHVRSIRSGSYVPTFCVVLALICLGLAAAMFAVQAPWYAPAGLVAGASLLVAIATVQRRRTLEVYEGGVAFEPQAKVVAWRDVRDVRFEDLVVNGIRVGHIARLTLNDGGQSAITTEWKGGAATVDEVVSLLRRWREQHPRK